MKIAAKNAYSILTLENVFLHSWCKRNLYTFYLHGFVQTMLVLYLNVHKIKQEIAIVPLPTEMLSTV